MENSINIIFKDFHIKHKEFQFLYICISYIYMTFQEREISRRNLAGYTFPRKLDLANTVINSKVATDLQDGKNKPENSLKEDNENVTIFDGTLLGRSIYLPPLTHTYPGFIHLYYALLTLDWSCNMLLPIEHSNT